MAPHRATSSATARATGSDAIAGATPPSHLRLGAGCKRVAVGLRRHDGGTTGAAHRRGGMNK